MKSSRVGRETRAVVCRELLVKLRLGILAIAVFTHAGAAFAQVEGGRPPASSPAGSSVDSLQEIVVTAQHRSEDLQHAALSVTAVTPELLTKASVTSAADLTAVVPALQASNQSGFSAMYIRGIGSYRFDGGLGGARIMSIDTTLCRRSRLPPPQATGYRWAQIAEELSSPQ
jgi:iron complex outermembrane receptor protein